VPNMRPAFLFSFKFTCVTLLQCAECPESAVPTALHFTAFAVHRMTGKCGTGGAALCGMHHTAPALAHVAVRTAQHSTENAVILRVCNVGAWLVCDNGSGLWELARGGKETTSQVSVVLRENSTVNKTCFTSTVQCGTMRCCTVWCGAVHCTDVLFSKKKTDKRHIKNRVFGNAWKLEHQGCSSLCCAAKWQCTGHLLGSLFCSHDQKTQCQKKGIS